MKTTNTIRSRRGKAGHAFSLIEILVVVTIMAVLMTIGISAVAPLLSASKVNMAVTQITDGFNLARQTALTRNRDVEVRIYLMGSSSNQTNKKFRAFRSFLADSTDPTKSEPLEKIKYLPDSVIISSDPKYSTLLDYSNTSRSGLTYLTEKISGRDVPYVSFLFRPGGGTNLLPQVSTLGNWYMTIYIDNVPVNSSTGLPHNYYTAQIDPATGRVRTYRP